MKYKCDPASILLAKDNGANQLVMLEMLTRARLGYRAEAAHGIETILGQERRPCDNGAQGCPEIGWAADGKIK